MIAREVAVEVAVMVHDYIAPQMDRMTIAGSLRRGAKLVSDVELVGQPKLERNLLGEYVEYTSERVQRAFEILGGKKIRAGDRYVRYEVRGVPVDFFLVHPPAQWGSILAIRTGPRNLSKHAVSELRNRGYRHEGGRVLELKTGEPVPVPEEEVFFELAGLPFVKPTERDDLAVRLWGAA